MAAARRVCKWAWAWSKTPAGLGQQYSARQSPGVAFSDYREHHWANEVWEGVTRSGAYLVPVLLVLNVQSDIELK